MNPIGKLSFKEKVEKSLKRSKEMLSKRQFSLESIPNKPSCDICIRPLDENGKETFVMVFSA